jgi:hypothetical protein
MISDDTLHAYMRSTMHLLENFMRLACSRGTPTLPALELRLLPSDRKEISAVRGSGETTRALMSGGEWCAQCCCGRRGPFCPWFCRAACEHLLLHISFHPLHHLRGELILHITANNYAGHTARCSLKLSNLLVPATPANTGRQL